MVTGGDVVIYSYHLVVIISGTSFVLFPGGRDAAAGDEPNVWVVEIIVIHKVSLVLKGNKMQSPCLPPLLGAGVDSGI